MLTGRHKLHHTSQEKNIHSFVPTVLISLFNIDSVTEIVLTAPSRGSDVSVRVKAMMSKYKVAGRGNALGTDTEGSTFCFIVNHRICC